MKILIKQWTDNWPSLFKLSFKLKCMLRFKYIPKRKAFFQNWKNAKTATGIQVTLKYKFSFKRGHLKLYMTIFLATVWMEICTCMLELRTGDNMPKYQ